MAFHDLEYTAEKPDIGFVVKLHQRKYIWPIEIVTLWPMFLPTSPCASVVQPNFQRLGYAVPSGEMNFEIREIFYWPDVAQEYRHDRQVPLMEKSSRPPGGGC